MRPITFRLALGRSGTTLDDTTPDKLQRLLNTLTAHNEEWLRFNVAPSIYDSGITYKRENDAEDWKDIPNALADGYADCEDIATYLAAELRHNGERADPFITYQRFPGRRVYHIRTRRWDLRRRTPPLITPNGVIRGRHDDTAFIERLRKARVLEVLSDGSFLEDACINLGMR